MHPASTQLIRRPSAASLLLVAGAALAAVGLARSPQGGGNPNPPEDRTQVIPMPGGGTTADSNNRMIAVTGVDVTGASLLYLVDTWKMRISVYQAAGSGAGQGLRFVGGRRIELDMELDGWNDKSEYSYKKLKEEFAKQGWTPGGADSSKPGVTPPAGGGGN